MTNRIRPSTTLAIGALALGSSVLVDSGTTRAQGAPPAAVTPAQIKTATQAVDGAAIQANLASSKDWPTIGLDYAETRYSKLAEINASNVKDLGLAWTYNLESKRGVETGISSETHVEIASGLDGGETIVEGPYRVLARDLKEGGRITIEKPPDGRDEDMHALCELARLGLHPDAADD